MNNQIESSSLYREIRLKQLLNNHHTINFINAAEILRNQNGINNKDIGLANEKALNQLIAHHAVIFKPQDKLMWVSANPFQCGKFICYNLDSVFHNAPLLNTNSEINVKENTITEDIFLSSSKYKRFKQFKLIKDYLNFITKKTHRIILNNVIEKAFILSNPQSYNMYQLLGDYYASQQHQSKAIAYYKIALKKECATLKEAKTINAEINRLLKKE
jgi:isopenicillin-N N-acyltransferase-like protein